jgi:hypothetical protein
MNTTVVPTIIMIIDIVNTTNVTNSTTDVVHNEKPTYLPSEIYILLLVVGALVGICMSIGLHECATKHGYNNFIHCIVCESIEILLICFLGETRAIKLMNCCRREPSNTSTRQRTYSDTSSEYSDYDDHDPHSPHKEVVITIEPAIMFESGTPQLYLEDDNDKKICSICCEELDHTDNSIDENENENEYVNTLVKLECDHYYHSKCIKQWYITSKNKDCPMCKKDIKIEDYYFT